MRDSDRHLVYGAEHEVALILDKPGTPLEIIGTTVMVPEERKFARVEDIQTYVDRVLEHTGNADKPCKVRVRKGQKRAHYLNNEIAIPDETRWAMRESVVLHELAHHLSNGEQSHGPEFRTMLCTLLGTVLAPEAQFLMQLAFWERHLTA